MLSRSSRVQLCNSMGCSPPGSSVHGILQARIEWVVISFSKGSSWPRGWTQVYAPVYTPNRARGLTIWYILTNACLFDNSHFDGCEVIAHCGLVLHFTVTSNVEHLFIYVLTTFISPLENCLFGSCAHLLIGFCLFVCFWCCIVWVLSIFFILSPYQTYYLQISSLIH